MNSRPAIPETEARKFDWLDVLWFVFLVALAVLPPRWEWHKQLILVAIGAVQFAEGQLIRRLGKRGPAAVVILKIVLASLLIAHTGEIGINSSYYPIYYLPVVTAALYFGPWATLFWTFVTSAAYCSYLVPALQEYDIDLSGIAQLVLRVMFFFLAAMLVNRFVQETRRQTLRYQLLAEQLAETNRQLERAQEEARRSERLAALGQLSAGLAHEIRNPLGVIRGSAEMLSQKLSSADALARELSEYILSETNRLSMLVTQFLSFARPLQADLHPGDVTQLLDHVLKYVADHWKGKAVQVERTYEPGLSTIPFDESLLEQAFVNLIQNAYEAMSDNGGILRVEARLATRGDTPGVELRLTDTGPGVPDKLREEIFNPFVTTKKTGVGLGLSIVSKIIDGHQGSIRVEKGPEGGASFRLFFPSTAAEPTSESASN